MCTVGEEVKRGCQKINKSHMFSPGTSVFHVLCPQCPFPQAQPQVCGTGTIPHGSSIAEIVFRCLRVVISLLIEIKPNYLMWSWCWFDFWNQDIFLNWIWKHCRTKAPTVLPQFSTTVDHLTNSSKNGKNLVFIVHSQFYKKSFEFYIFDLLCKNHKKYNINGL